jgi:hypothetical protein
MPICGLPVIGTVFGYSRGMSIDCHKIQQCRDKIRLSGFSMSGWSEAQTDEVTSGARF